MKKKEIIVIGLILVIAALGMLYMSMSKKEGDKVVVSVGGKVSKEFPLSKDTTFEIEGINGTNLLRIKDGKASISEATCPDKLCVNQHSIEFNGESLICLPNQVVVTVQGSKNNDIDGIVR